MTENKKQCKKLISLLLVFSLLLSLFSIIPMTSYAALAVGETFEDENGFTYKVNNDGTTVEVNNFDNSTAEVIIPENVKYEDVNYTVTSLLSTTNSPFRNNTVIESIKIPGTIKVIPALFFYKSSACKNVTLSNGVESIQSNAFRECTNLKTVYIPESVKEISSGAFNGCTSLTDVYCYSNDITINDNSFPSNVNFTFHCYEESKAYDFANSKKFTIDIMSPLETTAPETTAPPAEFKDGAFTFVVTGDNTVQLKAFDNSIADVEIPEKVTNNDVEYTVNDIAPDVFKSNKKITSVKVPATIETISRSAFSNCTSLKSVTTEVKNIEMNAFSGCTSLATVELNNTETIGGSAFNECAIVTLELPSTLKETTGSSAFANCKSLTTVTFNSDVKLSGFEFSADSALRDIYFKSDNVNISRYLLYNIGTNNPMSTKKITIYGNIGSEAHKFADENDITFKTLEGELVTKPAETTAATEATTAAEETTVATEATTAASETTVATEATTAAEPTEATTAVVETTAPVQTVEVLLGDADGSGKIDVKDVTHIQKHIASYFTLEGTPALAADVDGKGTIDVNDATLIQKYLASYNVDYKIGEVVQFGSDTPAPTADNPQPTEGQKPTEEATTTATPETTGSAEPATTAPAPSHSIDDGTFYLPNYVDWLDNDGGKMWIYNNDTQKAIYAENYEKNADGLCGYFYFKNNLPDDWSEWTNISIYRTPYDVTPETLDINSKWDEASQTGCILNSWLNIGDKGTFNAFRIVDDNNGNFEQFDPNAKPEIGDRTIYFDNSKTKWDIVYLYGWNFGIDQKWIEMDQLMDENGNDLDIWSYTFTDWKSSYEGSEGFLFVNKTNWSGQSQTVNLKTEQGKDLFIPSSSYGISITGKWDVYTP